MHQTEGREMKLFRQPRCEAEQARSRGARGGGGETCPVLTQTFARSSGPSFRPEVEFPSGTTRLQDSLAKLPEQARQTRVRASSPENVSAVLGPAGCCAEHVAPAPWASPWPL